MTNGFDKTKVLDVLRRRIGWQQPTLAGYNIVDADNLTSDSGLYYNQFHALCSVVNLKDTQENPMISDSAFNTWLTSLGEQAVLGALNGVFSEPQLVESVRLFEPTDNYEPNTETGSKFVGYRIKLAPGHSLRINSTTLTFGNAATFSIYLFHHRKLQPLQTKEVTTVANEATTISLGWELSETDSTQGGIYYLGYFQSEDLSALDYQECKNKTYAFGVLPVELDHTDNVINPNRYTISPNSTFGLNLDISAYRDYTYRIIRNAHLFDELIGLTMASMVLEHLVHSVRTNKTERTLKDNTQLLALYNDLNTGDESETQQRVPGVKRRLQAAQKQARASFFHEPTITATHP